MKRIMSIALILICVMSLVGCGRSMNDVIGKEPDFVGIVQEVTGDYLIVNVNEDDVVYENCPVVQVPLNVEIEDSYLDCVVGDEVVVYYDGNITDGEPTIVEKVYAITLRTPADRTSITDESECLELPDIENCNMEHIDLSNESTEMQVITQVDEIVVMDNTLYTNSTEITVSCEKLSNEESIVVFLYNADDMENPILQGTLSKDENSVTFKGLTSRFDYVIGAESNNANRTIILKITD